MSKQRTVLVIATFLAILVGTMSSSSSRYSLSVRADEPDVASLALAQRYLNRGGVNQSIDLLPGQVATDLPLPLPQPANSRVVGTVTQRILSATRQWTVILDAPDTPDAVLAFYEQQLPAVGWTVNGNLGFPLFRQGFLPSVPTATAARPPSASIATAVAQFGALRQFCPTTGDGEITVSARPMAGGMTDVQVSVQSLGGFCRYPLNTMQQGQLPPLMPPPNVLVTSAFSGDATANTSMNAVQLEAFYAQQLEAAGWTRTGGNADGPLSYSLWTVPTASNMQGYLSVLEIPGTTMRSLHLQIGATTGSSGGITIRATFTEPRATPVPAP